MTSRKDREQALATGHSDNMTLDCPLCTRIADFLAEDRVRGYFQCRECALIFADPRSRLSAIEEKQVYDLHENRPDDPRYRNFLNRLARPLLEKLTPGECGLDYGCGPGPTLSVILQEAGMSMEIYDPFYAPEKTVLQRKYDFVTCTEVAEHFHRPVEEWARMAGLLHPGSWLGIMTKLFSRETPFEQWYYKNDPTHVSFYSRTTFDWLAVRFGFTIEPMIDDQVVLLRKH